MSDTPSKGYTYSCAFPGCTRAVRLGAGLYCDNTTHADMVKEVIGHFEGGVPHENNRWLISDNDPEQPPHSEGAR